MGSFSKIKKLLEEKDSFLLIGHKKPDGDCLGSILALGEILESLGKKVVMACKDTVPEAFDFLPSSSKIKSDFLFGDFEAVILLDNGDFKRTGFAKRIKDFGLKRIPVVNIDHHPKNDLWRIATINYVDENASSTAELLFEIFQGIKIDLSPRVATALLAGIFYDTGGFHHSNTSAKVYKIVSELLKRGAKLRKISDNIGNVCSIPMLKLWGIALSRMHLNSEYKIAASIVLQSDLAETGADEEEVSGLVNLINSIPEAEVALLLYETADGKIKGSLRTESDRIDVSKLAKVFGGGGHKKASGFMVEGKIVQDGDGWKVA